MTRFLAVLAEPGEAATALAGGAELLGVPGTDPAMVRAAVACAGQAGVVALLAGVAAVVVGDPAAGDPAAGTGPAPQPSVATLGRAGAAWVGLAAAAAGAAAEQARATPGPVPRVVAVLPAEPRPDPETLASLAKRGVAAALLDLDAAGQGRARRPLDLPAASGFVAACRSAGLLAWIGGGLEPPDVPRLLVLRPDVLGFSAALRGRAGGLRAEAVAAIRALIPPLPGVAPGFGRARGTDSVFVRDLVLAVQVGAYAHERGDVQRVRFAVQAWVARATGPARGMADVFSYDIITDGIRLLTAGRHVSLLETLAEEIAGMLLAHAAVLRVAVRLEKLDTGNGIVGCAIERGREGGDAVAP